MKANTWYCLYCDKKIEKKGFCSDKCKKSFEREEYMEGVEYE
jgi:predicted nucleic acid-binding Zn ribbon protein